MRFSVDTLAERLNISKKTIYKFFPNKEALAFALYQKYYADIKAQAAGLTTEQLASLAGISRQLYSRRRSAPQDLTVAELQKLTAVLHLDKFPGASDAMLRLLA